MKKRFLTLTVLSGILTLVLYSCGSRLNSITLSKDTICTNYNDDISKLPYSLVYDMVEGYKDKQLKQINNGLVMDDARAIWFDLETLKKFVYHIENEAKNNTQKPTSINKLGIRIYYANYPNIETWETKYDSVLVPFMKDKVKSKYEGLHTLVMIPTIRTEDGKDMDFDPTINTTYNFGLEGINNQSNQFITAFQSILLQVNQSNSIGAQNHGAMHPPHAPNGMTF